MRIKLNRSIKPDRSFKGFRSMLLILLFMLPAVLAFGADNEKKDLQKTVTISMKDVSLNQIIWEIKKQTGLIFTYNTDDVEKVIIRELNVVNEPVYRVLAQCLVSTDVEYSVVEGVIVLRRQQKQAPPPPPSIAQPLEIKGKVMDADGEPLVGATIIVKELNKGVIADLDGHFILKNVSPGQTITISFIGKESVEQVVSTAKTVFNVTLYDSRSLLEEVVVSGYQTISKERSAGSYSIISGENIKEKAAITGSILSALEGVAPGLYVNMGVTGDRFLVRGTTSIMASRKPLIVIDGVPVEDSVTESMLNSDDIKSVTLLKDATAASIWGARAANGVLVITTKTGERNEKVKVSYNGAFTFNGKPDFDYLDLMNSKTFIQTAVELFDPVNFPLSFVNGNNVGKTSLPTIFPHEQPLYQMHAGEISQEKRDEALMSLVDQNGHKEYEKYFMSNSYMTNHSVSFSGGNEIQNFYVSAGYQRNQGADKNVHNEYRIIAKNNIDAAKWLNLDLNINAMYGKNDGHILPSNIYNRNISMLPYIRFHDNEGNPASLTNYIMNNEIRQEAESISGIHLDYYPIDDFNSSISDWTNYSVRAQLGMTIKLYEGLKYNGLYQYHISNRDQEHFEQGDSYKVRLNRVYATNKNGVRYLPDDGGDFLKTHNRQDAYTVRNQLDYDKSFGTNHDNRITALAGLEVISSKMGVTMNSLKAYNIHTLQYVDYDQYFLNKYGVTNPVLIMPNTIGANKFAPNGYSQSEYITRFISMYANASYTYEHRYTLNGNIRVDRSNAFGNDPGEQYKPIWSVGGIWNMKTEQFMRNLTSVNLLNLRFSYGYAGNSPLSGQGGIYHIIRAISSHPYYPGIYDGLGMAYAIRTPANNKLTWEKTRIWNAGVDFQLLKHRLNGSFDVYNKRTTDLLSNIPIDPMSGFQTTMANAGEMVNKGFELSLNSVNIIKPNLRWNTNITFSYNKNEVTKFYNDTPRFAYLIFSQDIHEGRPMESIFAYKWAGLDPADGSPGVYNAEGEIVKNVNDIKTEDIVHKGTAIPPFNSSLTNTIRYNDWELSFIFICNAGHVMRNDVNYSYTGRLIENKHNDLAQRWRKPGDEKITDVPAYYTKESGYNDTYVLLYSNADINVVNASYIRLRDLSLRYYFPAQACRYLKVSSMRITAQVTNLWLIAFNKEGIDPEAFYLRGGTRSLGNKPSWSLNLSVNF